MKYLFFILLAPLACASTVTETASLADSQSCNAYVACAPLVFEVQQVPGATSVDFTFTDQQTVGFGINTMYQPIGESYSVGTTTYVTQPNSGLLDSSVVMHSGVIQYWRQIGTSIAYYTTELVLSGTLPASMFDGAGMVGVEFDLGMLGSWVNGVIAEPVSIQDSATFSDTIDPPNAVPEPRMAGMLLICGLALAWRRRSMA